MKKYMLICAISLGLLAPTITHAQLSFRFSDLFKQNKKERRNMLQQIAHLQVYLQAVKEGYRLTQSGLNTIHDIKNGEFTVHDLFYLSKQQVSPAIRRYPAALQTISHAHFVQRHIQQFLNQVGKDKLLDSEQKDFIRKTSAGLLADVARNTDELQTVLSDGKLQLSDQERIQRIEKTLARSRQQVSFTKMFCTDARMLATSLHKEAAEAAMVKGYYELLQK